MLPAQFADDEHRGGRFVDKVAALIDLYLYAPFELLLRYEVVNKRVVEHGLFPPLLLPRRALHGRRYVADGLAPAHQSGLRSPDE